MQDRVHFIAVMTLRKATASARWLPPRGSAKCPYNCMLEPRCSISRISGHDRSLRDHVGRAPRNSAGQSATAMLAERSIPPQLAACLLSSTKMQEAIAGRHDRVRASIVWCRSGKHRLQWLYWAHATGSFHCFWSRLCRARASGRASWRWTFRASSDLGLRSHRPCFSCSPAHTCELMGVHEPWP